MTRLHQALERAKAIRSQTQAGRAEVSEATQAPRQPPVPEGKAARRAEPLDSEQPSTEEFLPAIESVGPIKCSACRMPYEGHRRGPWTKRLLRLIGLPPYRCRHCRQRFSGHEEPAVTQAEGWEFSAFLSPDDGRSFHDLIRDLAEDEHEKEADGPSSGVPSGERTKDVLKPESWPAVGGIHRKHPRL